jgi:hypothetical protein
MARPGSGRTNPAHYTNPVARRQSVQPDLLPVANLLIQINFQFCHRQVSGLTWRLAQFLLNTNLYTRWYFKERP